jgi:hypothetical protein
MIARQIDPMVELKSAFDVLTKNITLAAIPTVAFVVICGMFLLVLLVTGASALLGGGMNDPSVWMGALAGGAVFFGIALIIAIIVSLIAQAAVIAASEAAWEGRQPDLGAGVGRAFSKAGELFLAGLLLALIAIAVSWTFVGLIALGFLMMYVVPAIVLSGEGATAAIGTSWRMSTQNFGPTAGAFLGLIVAGIAAGIINAILGHIPVVGWIGVLIVYGFYSAYQALVVVRFYGLLRSAGAPPAVNPGPPPTPVS